MNYWKDIIKYSAKNDGNQPKHRMRWLSRHTRSLLKKSQDTVAHILPAVMAYHQQFHSKNSKDLSTYLLNSFAIRLIYQDNQPDSESTQIATPQRIALHSAMAAAGLAAINNGSKQASQHAAELAIEYHLLGAQLDETIARQCQLATLRAVNASKLALADNDLHLKCLDSTFDKLRNTL